MPPDDLVTIRNASGQSMVVKRSDWEAMRADAPPGVSLVEDVQEASPASGAPSFLSYEDPAMPADELPYNPEAPPLPPAPVRDPADVSDPLAAAAAGYAQGTTSNLAQHGAAALAKAMAPEARPKMEMLGPEGKAMLARHPEFRARFEGTSGGDLEGDQALAGVQDTLAAHQEDNRLPYVAGDIAGGVTQALLLSRILGPMAGPVMARLPQLAKAKAAMAAAPKALQVAGGTALAAGTGGLEAGVRSAADTAAGEDIDAREVATDAMTGAMFGGAGSLIMRALAAGGRKAWNALRGESEAAKRVKQLESSGGKMEFLRGAVGDEGEEQLRKQALDEAYDNAMRPPGARDLLPVESTAQTLGHRAARETVVPALARAEREALEEMASENQAFYRTIAGQTPVRPAMFEAELEKLVKEGEGLPFVNIGAMKGALRAIRERGGLTAQEMDRTAAALADEINFAQKSGSTDPALSHLYGLLRQEMGRFDEVEEVVREGMRQGLPEPALREAAARVGRGEVMRETPVVNGAWARTKDRHASVRTNLSDRRTKLGIGDRNLPANIENIPDEVNRRVGDLLTVFDTRNDSRILEVAKELGIEDAIRPVRREAARAALHRETPRVVASSSLKPVVVGMAPAMLRRLSPLAAAASRLSRAENMAVGGAFLGTNAERLESVVGNMPRNTVDFLMLYRAAKKRKEQEKEQ